MTARNHIVCVEWTEPVSARWLMAEPEFGRPDGKLVYVVSLHGKPIYVGCTGFSVGYRLLAHCSSKTVLGRLLRSLGDDIDAAQVRWTAGDGRLEFQLQRALRPRLNVINTGWSAYHARRAA